MLIFVNEKQEEKAPKWMLILRAILIGACIMLTFALVAVYANQAHGSYSYQSYFSQFREVWTSCEDNIIKQDVPSGFIDNTELIRDLKQQLAVAEENNGKPIFKTIEVASQLCTERIVEKPYCGNGKLDLNEDFDDGSGICKNQTKVLPTYLAPTGACLKGYSEFEGECKKDLVKNNLKNNF